MVADSRAVALNHTAGLSVPQQLQMALFALNGLMDREHRYKDAAKQLIRKRYQTLYSHMGVTALRDSKDVNYYSLIDLQEIGGTLYGPEFKAWFIKSDLGIDFLFRLADETGSCCCPAMDSRWSIHQPVFLSPTSPRSNTPPSANSLVKSSTSAIKTSRRPLCCNDAATAVRRTEMGSERVKRGRICIQGGTSLP